MAANGVYGLDKMLSGGSESSFEVPGDSRTGWRQYTFTKTVSSRADGVYIAFGISVRWETYIERYFDVSITVTTTRLASVS